METVHVDDKAEGLKLLHPMMLWKWMKDMTYTIRDYK